MGTAPRTVRVAAVQAAPALLDLPTSLARLDEWTRRAAAQGARLVAFGETWLTGLRVFLA
ncbi:MAG: nitrilase-related carbon-nitrogen hydrolase [Gemmatimonadales bacterium]